MDLDHCDEPDSPSDPPCIDLSATVDQLPEPSERRHTPSPIDHVCHHDEPDSPSEPPPIETPRIPSPPPQPPVAAPAQPEINLRTRKSIIEHKEASYETWDVPVAWYNQGRWEEASNQVMKHLLAKSKQSSEKSHIKLITYNILFDEKSGPDRWPLLLDELRRQDADIICLQEVTRLSLDTILSLDWVRNGYYSSEGGYGQTIAPYGVLILSRIPLTSLVLHELPTRMHRKVLVAQFMAQDGTTFVVATSHLESYTWDRAVRYIQLKLISDILRPSPFAIICGDFNFDEDVKENEDVFEGSGPLSKFVDVWKEKGEGDGVTWDPRNNALTRATVQSDICHRYDRFALRRDVEGMEIESIHVIGAGETKDWSDHYGLALTINTTLLFTRRTNDPSKKCSIL